MSSTTADSDTRQGLPEPKLLRQLAEIEQLVDDGTGHNWGLAMRDAKSLVHAVRVLGTAVEANMLYMLHMHNCPECHCAVDDSTECAEGSRLWLAMVEADRAAQRLLREGMPDGSKSE